MRKLFANLILILFLFTITGCANSFNNPNPDGKNYNLFLIDDNDVICNEFNKEYQSGTKITFESSVVYDASYSVYLNNKKIQPIKTENRTHYYEFTMPNQDVVIYTSFNHQPLKKQYSFSDLYDWTKSLSNVKNVAVYIKNDSFKEFSKVYYISNKTDVNKLIDVLDQSLVMQFYHEEISKDPNLVIKYNTDSNSYSLKFIDNILIYEENNRTEYYKIKNEQYEIIQKFIFESHEITYKFEYNGKSSDIKKVNGDSFVKKFNKINAVEFIKYSGVEFSTVDAEYYIDSVYGKIELITKDIFRLNGNYFQIIDGNIFWPVQYVK